MIATARTRPPCPDIRWQAVGSPIVSAVDLLIAAGVAFLAGGINSSPAAAR